MNDYTHFVTGFFNLISTSSPHIYHSALPLTPKTSIVRRLYEPHAHPLTRIVCGLPTSWEQGIVSAGFPSFVETAVWSPCNRFIAIVWGGTSSDWGAVEILDAVALGRLNIFPLDRGNMTQHLSFSPDTRLITWFGESPGKIISWDVQTGVLVSTIIPVGLGYSYHISTTYSTCGTMVGICSPSTGISTISTYNVLSGKHMYSHSVVGPNLVKIWTHGKYLRYIALNPGSLTIWEAGFASIHPLTEVKSLPIPDNFYPKHTHHIHPTLCRLSFIIDGRVIIWDAQCSKYLLDFADIKLPVGPSFSSDGHLFGCGTWGSEFYLWKESPTGYILHQKFRSNTESARLCISPDGELALTFGGLVIQLWHTADPNTPLPSISTQVSQKDERSPLLGFSPDKTLAVVTWREDKTVTVLDLKSGIPRLMIDTGMGVYGLGVAGDTIVVVGDKRVVAWNLPARDCVSDLRVDIGDSVWATTFDELPDGTPPLKLFASVSPDLQYTVFMEIDTSKTVGSMLHLYDVLTGQHLDWDGGIFRRPWFTLDGCEVWCSGDNRAHRWKLIKKGKSNITKLEHQDTDEYPLGALPWQCLPGYEVTEDGWILHSSGKQLLWLPPHWWPDWQDRVWGGQFLALLNGKLPEVIILELD